MTANTPLLITFGLYLAAMLLLGFHAWQSTRSFDDYILGGRSLGGYVTALSAGASDMSGWLLMGLPGAIYASGLVEAWVAIGLCVGAWLNWRFVAGPLRVYTEYCEDALTLPDYFTSRFDQAGRLLRIVAALVILFFFAVYAAAGIVAGARLFESVFGLPYAQAVWWGAAATIAYTMIGGFLAVSWTDTVQATLMIGALLLVPLMILLSLFGWDNSVELINKVDPARLDWLGAGGGIAVVSALAWGLGYFGQPHILARFMAAESVRTIPKARRIGMVWMVLCLLGAVGVGLLGIAYLQPRPEVAAVVNANPERVFIVLAQQLFNPWIAGILLSAILAAIMSTLSCQLLVCSSALTEDLYRGFLRPNAGQKELVWIGRTMVLAVSLVAIVIAWDPDSRVLGLVSHAWAGFGAAFGPVVVVSLLWSRMTGWGALAGMMAGAFTVVLWANAAQVDAASAQAASAASQLLPVIARGLFGPAHDAWPVYEMVPGCIAAVLAIVVVSLLGRAPSEQVRTTHQDVRDTLKTYGY